MGRQDVRSHQDIFGPEQGQVQGGCLLLHLGRQGQRAKDLSRHGKGLRKKAQGHLGIEDQGGQEGRIPRQGRGLRQGLVYLRSP